MKNLNLTLRHSILLMTTFVSIPCAWAEGPTIDSIRRGELKVESVKVSWRIPVSAVADNHNGTLMLKNYDLVYRARDSKDQLLEFRFLLEEVPTTQYDYEHHVRSLSLSDELPMDYAMPSQTKLIQNSSGALEIELMELLDAVEKRRATTLVNPGAYWTRGAVTGEIEAPKNLRHAMLDPQSYWISISLNLSVSFFLLPKLFGPLIVKAPGRMLLSFTQIFKANDEELKAALYQLPTYFGNLAKASALNLPVIAFTTFIVMSPFLTPPILLKSKFGLKVLAALGRLPFGKKVAVISAATIGMSTSLYLCAGALKQMAIEALPLNFGP